MGKSTRGPLERGDVFAQAFEGSTDATVITDRDGHIVHANPAWLALYGFELDEVVGKTTRIIKSEHSGPALYDYMWQQIRDPRRGSWRGELVNRKRNGEEVPVLLSITPIFERAEVVGYMGVGIDMTERKQVEELRRLYEMVVRHDLKAPLGAAEGLLDTLAGERDGPLTEGQRDLVERSLARVRQMRALLDTTLDLEELRQRKLRLAPASIDLVALVSEVLDGLAHMGVRKGLRYRLLVDGEPARPGDGLVCHLDPLHTQRCIENLVQNAIASSPPGGEVTAGFVREERAPGRCAARVRFESESGPIPPDVQATLFHPYSTYGKAGGLGLGMYGVKLAVESMGGSVSCDTRPGRTLFELRFPMTR